MKELIIYWSLEAAKSKIVFVKLGGTKILYSACVSIGVIIKENQEEWAQMSLVKYLTYQLKDLYVCYMQ